MSQTPKGFWSYAQADDKHLDGVLSDLRHKVAGEVSMLLGHDVDIFQDIRSLRTGDRWEERLRAEVTAATFLVPVLTPRYFNRPFCREETLTFLRVAREQGVEPRIFPILFVELDEEEGDEVRAALAEFQYKDFSTWRFESDPTRRQRMLNEFAKDVKARLKVVASARPATPARRPLQSTTEAAPQAKPSPQAAPALSKFPTLTVDPMPGRADFSSITAAIDAAQPGVRIVVRPGTYREALRLSKPLELIGEGAREQIVVTRGKGKTALDCDAPMARVLGMTFRPETGGGESLDEESYGVQITSGAVEMEDCVIESKWYPCVAISGAGTTATLRRCVARGGGGLSVREGARPLVEDCEMEGSRVFGVTVSGEGTNATLRRCLARDAKGDGYSFSDGAGGLLERCEAIGNGFFGISIIDADPLLRDCALRDNEKGGVFVRAGGRGRLEGCVIERNGTAGVLVFDGAPTVKECTIRSNKGQAVYISAEGGGTFEDNDLRGNTRGAWDVAKDVGDRLVRRNNREK